MLAKLLLVISLVFMISGPSNSSVNGPNIGVGPLYDSTSSSGSGSADRTSANCAAELAGISGEICQDTVLNELFICETGPCADTNAWVSYSGASSGESYSPGTASDWTNYVVIPSPGTAPASFTDALDALSSWAANWWSEEGVYHLWWYRLRYTSATALSEALTDCDNAISSGKRGCVFILPRTGSIVLTSPLIIGRLTSLMSFGITIKGVSAGPIMSPSEEGLGGSIIDCSSIIDGPACLTFAGVHHLVLQDFTILRGDGVGNLIDVVSDAAGIVQTFTSQHVEVNRVSLYGTTGDGITFTGLGSSYCVASPCTIASGASITYTDLGSGITRISGANFAAPVSYIAGDWVYVDGTTHDGWYQAAVNGGASSIDVYDRDILTALTETSTIKSAHRNSQVDKIRVIGLNCAYINGDCVIQRSTQSVASVFESVNWAGTNGVGSGVNIEAGSAIIRGSAFTPGDDAGVVAGIELGFQATEISIYGNEFEVLDGYAILCNDGVLNRGRTISDNRFLMFAENEDGNYIFDCSLPGKLIFSGNTLDSNAASIVSRIRLDGSNGQITLYDSANELRNAELGAELILDFEGAVDIDGETGMVAGVATLKTLDYWRNHLGDLPFPAKKYELHFNAYEGSDSAAGTETNPLQTFSKLKTSQMDFAELVLQSGQAFSDNTYRLTSVAGRFVPGETVSDGASYSGIVLDYDTATRYLVLKDTASTISGSVTLTGADSGTTATANSTACGSPPCKIGTLGAQADSILALTNTSTRYNNRVLMHITSNAPWNDKSLWPILHCNAGEMSGSGNQHAFEGQGTGNGWIGVSKVIVEDCDIDAFSQQGTAQMLFWKNAARQVRNATETNNNCITSHSTGQLIAILNECEGFPEDVNGTPFAMTANSEIFTALNSITVDMSAAGASNAGMVLDGGDWTSIGDSVVARNASASFEVKGVNVQAFNYDAHFRCALLTIDPDDVLGVGFGHQALSGFDISTKCRQVTITNFATGIRIPISTGATSSIFDLQGALFDGGEISLFRATGVGDEGTHDVTLRGAYDTEDPWTTMFFVGADSYNTVAAMQGDAQVAAAGWSIFQSSSTEINTTSNGDSTDALPGQPCAGADENCWNGYDGEYFIPLPVAMMETFPLELTDGSQMIGFSPGWTPTNFGAR